MRASLPLALLVTCLGQTAALAEPTIEVGTLEVGPDTVETFAIDVSGGDAVQGLDFYLQVGDGGAPNGGSDTLPVVTGVDIVGPGTLFSVDNTGQRDVYASGLLWNASTTSSAGPLSASGAVAWVTLDTTGTVEGQTYPLRLSGVGAGLLGEPGVDTAFATVSANITNGMISIVSPIQPQWKRDADAAWTHAGNWYGGTPGGMDAEANFLDCVTQPVSVTVDAPVTVGGLTFDCDEPYALTGTETISMEVTAGQAEIDVATGTHEIAVPLDLATDAALMVAGDLAVSGTLSTAAGVRIEKSGEGLLIIEGPQNHGPDCLFEILDGTVAMNTPAGKADGANLDVTVSGNGLVEFGTDQYLDVLTISDNAVVRLTGGNVVVVKNLVMNGVPLGAMTLTPEPATLALLALGGLSVLACRRQRRDSVTHPTDG